MISQIPPLFINVRTRDTLRGNSTNDIRKSLDRLVRNRVFPLDDKHQQLRGTTFLTCDALVQILAVAVHGFSGGIKVAELDDGLFIDAHTIALCDHAERLDELGQRAIVFIATSIVEDEDPPTSKVFRLMLIKACLWRACTDCNR